MEGAGDEDSLTLGCQQAVALSHVSEFQGTSVTCVPQGPRLGRRPVWANLVSLACFSQCLDKVEQQEAVVVAAREWAGVADLHGTGGATAEDRVHCSAQVRRQDQLSRSPRPCSIAETYGFLGRIGSL